MTLPFKTYSSKYYWIVRRKIASWKFQIRRHLFNLKKLIKGEFQKTSSSVSHIKISFWNVVKTVIFVSVLFLIEHYSSLFWYANLDSFPDWLVQLQKIIPKPSYPADKDSILYLVSVIASVTGVILALFYPVLATIASTAYAKVHASIRNLLLYEKETQNYLKRLTYLTASSITVLLLMSFHYLPGNLVLAYIFFYSLTTLFGILKIGLGVYRFFEPSTLANIVLIKLSDTIKEVTTNGVYFNDKNFQNYYNKIAYEQTENLSLITSLCTKDDDLQESSFKKSIEKSFFALQFYLSIKSRIPVNSLWFPNVYSHDSYFESGMSERRLSKNTNTYIQPKVKQNHYWLEERIIENISKGIDAVVKSGKINVLGETILMTHSVFDFLGSSTEIKTGKMLLDKLKKSITNLDNNKIEVLNYEDWKQEMGSVETYCTAVAKFQLIIFDQLAQITSNQIEKEFNKIKWNNENSIYASSFIPELYEQLEKIKSFIKNEEEVENSQVTPQWYFLQKLIAEYLFIVTDKVDNTINLFDIHILSIADHFEKKGNPLLATYVVHIGLDLIVKLRYRISRLKPILAELGENNKPSDLFKWKIPDWENIEERVSIYENNCFKIITNNIEQLRLVKWDKQFPDVYAQSYSILSTRINECYIRNDVDVFNKCFPVFIETALKAFGHLNKVFKHYTKPLNISYQTLLDALELSGYAYIYSVIYNKPEYWLSAKEAWDESFINTENNIELVARCYSYYRNEISATGVNFIEKHERELSLRDITKQLGVKPSTISDFFVKPFIKNSSISSFYNVAELFIELYIFTSIESRNAVKLFRRDIFEHVCRNIDNPNPNIYDDY